MPTSTFAAAQQRFRDLVMEGAPTDGSHGLRVPDLFLHRRAKADAPMSVFNEASLCLVAQGRKRVVVGAQEFVYDTDHFLISSVAMPISAQVLEASVEAPYLGLTWKIDLTEVSQIVVDAQAQLPASGDSGVAMSVGELDLELLEGFSRLVSLAKDPDAIAVLEPLLKREILYRLLRGPQGAYLRQLGVSGTRNHQIAQAVAWLKEHYRTALDMEGLANLVHMSPSSFYGHFREVTGLSPLQYQKWLRLQEARQLMINEGVDAATAGFKVGYESASQFSREYRRLFDAPPQRHVRLLKTAL